MSVVLSWYTGSRQNYLFRHSKEPKHITFLLLPVVHSYVAISEVFLALKCLKRQQKVYTWCTSMVMRVHVNTVLSWSFTWSFLIFIYFFLIRPKRGRKGLSVSKRVNDKNCRTYWIFIRICMIYGGKKPPTLKLRPHIQRHDLLCVKESCAVLRCYCSLPGMW